MEKADTGRENDKTKKAAEQKKIQDDNEKDRLSKEAEERESRIDESVEESFPASDPPSWSPTVAH